MSTRSAIGLPDGARLSHWRGRYVHSNGYPSAKVPELLEFVRRDGLETFCKVVLEEHYGWSYLDPKQPDITGVRAPSKFEDVMGHYGTPEYVAYMFSKNGGYGDGRFLNVPGYGVAYTEKDGQSSPNMWVTPGNDWGIEWAYVLDEDGFTVIETWRDRRVGRVTWDGAISKAVEHEIKKG